MSVQVFALVTFNEDQPRALADYMKATAPLLDQAGAQIINRFVIRENDALDRPPQSVIVVRYPDRAAVDKVFGSQTYKDIIPTRDKAFLDYTIFLVSDDSTTVLPT